MDIARKDAGMESETGGPDSPAKITPWESDPGYIVE